MSEIPEDLIEVSAEAAAWLRMPGEEVKAMSLRQFINRATDLGYDVEVSFGKVIRQGQGRLKITTAKGHHTQITP
jgi:hypothetical protein